MTSVYELRGERFDDFEKHLKKLGFRFEEREHQVFLARYEKFTVNLFKSGKVTFSGKDITLQQEVEWYLAKIGGKPAEPSPGIGFGGKTRIGTDEVGKGDYFGPLVVGGALVTRSMEETLAKAGVKDSKRISSDARIFDVAKGVKGIVGDKGWSVVAINPAKYNELHEKMGNVNELLGWAHARAIENLLRENDDCRLAIADQFGNERYITDSLMKKGREIRLVQTHKGERDVAVAAASILARERFIASMDRMGQEYGIEFPRGSSNVLATAKEFVSEHGRKGLASVAKMHFSITGKL